MLMLIHKVYRSDPDYVACGLDLVTGISYGMAEGWDPVTCHECLSHRPRASMPPKSNLQVVLDEVARLGRLWDSKGQPFEVRIESTAWVMHVYDHHSGLVLLDMDLDGNILYVHAFWGLGSPLLEVDEPARARHQLRVAQFRMIETRSFQDNRSLERVLQTQKEALIRTQDEPTKKALGCDIEVIRAIQVHRQGGRNPYALFNLPATAPEAP
jgi:hypothetical protein